MSFFNIASATRSTGKTPVEDLIISDADLGLRARRTIDRLIEMGLEPKPKNYAVIYAYEEKSDPKLTQAVDAQVATGKPLSNFQIEQIHADNIEQERSAETFREISKGLNNHVKSVQTLIDQGIRHGSEYSREVTSIADGLASPDNHEALMNCAEEIRASNRNLVANMEQLNKGLADAQSNVTRLERELKEVRANANTDHLTGLANRRRMDEFIDQHFEMAVPQSDPLSLVLIDIDNFKTVNDNFGHDAGDNILRHYGGLLMRNTKGNDMAARYGGEEFCLVLPNTPLEGAEQISQIIRKSFEECNWSSRQSGRDIGTVTASFGVAEHRSGETVEALIKRADVALYRAKESGRNLVCCSEQE